MSENPIALDTVLDLCQDQYRRIVLKTLAEEQRSLTLDDLTEAILKYHHGMSPGEASKGVLLEIRRSLYDLHLPKLAASGFIHHDLEHGLVEPAEQLDQVQPTLSTILDADPSLKTPMAR